MARGIRHPVSMHTYEAEGARRVRVLSRTGWGLFTENGEWIEGQLRYADPTFCRWIASGFIMQEKIRAESSTKLS